MSFEANNDYIYNLFGRKIYHIPRNQRKYVWKNTHWAELYEDVRFVAEHADKNKSHFIGSIVLKDEGRKRGLKNYTIIDGQQRIITLSIFLLSITYWMKYYDMIDDFNGTAEYISAKDDKGSRTIMVTSEYHKSLENIVQAILDIDVNAIKNTSPTGFIDSKVLNKSKDGSVAAAFKYYLLELRKEFEVKEDPKEYLVEMRDAIVGISYVNIVSSSEEDSYTIFEILNARGLALEDHELLKNYIMRHLYPEEERDTAKDIWNEIETILGNQITRFIHHYTIHKYGYSKDESDYAIIKRKNKHQQTEALLKDLRVKTEYYEKLINPTFSNENANCSATEYLIFSFFRKKRHEQMRPVLLGLIHHKITGEITEKEYNSALLFIYNFYVCYNIIGEENSNKLSNTVYKYALLIENQFSINIVEKFTEELKNKLPKEATFINAFKNVGWSHHVGFFEGDKNKARVQTVLEVFERYLSGNCQENFTIEHIEDDSESAQNGIIGNLIPLEEKLNRKCIGKKFKEKLIIYKESNYKTTRKFAERYSEKDFNMNSRTEHLGKQIYREVLKFSPDKTN